MVVIFGVAFNSRVRRFLLFSIPIAALFLSAAISYTPLGEYYSLFFSKDAIVYGVEGSSVSSRLSDIENSFVYFEQHVLFGFGDRTIKNLVAVRTISDIGFLESNFMRLLLAFGIIGFILFLTYLLLVAKKLLARIRLKGKIDLRGRMVSIVALALIVGYAENSLHSAWINEQLLLVFINLPFIFLHKASSAEKA